MSDHVRIEVENDELRTVRDGMRELHRMVGELDDGTVEKIVLTRKGKMCAVVIPWDLYQRWAAGLYP